MKDSFGREINYARISITDRCNLRCKYCMPSQGIDKKESSEMLSYEEIDSVLNAFKQLGIKKIRFTGGEPLVRKGAAEFICSKIKKYSDMDFYITTNATELNKYAKIFKEAGLKGVNISIDTLNKENYKKITRGGNIETALLGLEKVLSLDFDSVKINAVLTKEVSLEEELELINLTLKHTIDVRFIELMPIGECKHYANINYRSSDVLINYVGKLEVTNKKDKSSPANLYKLPNAKGNVGFISPISCKFCSDCNRIRLTSDGMLKPCLNTDQEIYIGADLLNSKKTLEKIKKSIEIKPQAHDLLNNQIKRNMKRIGG